MPQHSIFGRIGQLARANVPALLDQAENPQEMLDQMIRDYAATISDAEGAVAQTIGNLRIMEQDAREEQAAAALWGAKATAASQKADEMRAAGDTARADKFDDMARVALRRQIDGEDDAMNLAVAIADECEVVDRLKDGISEMWLRLEELRGKRAELVSREAAAAHGRARDSIRTVDILDPACEIIRFEAKIRREEARIRAQQKLDASSLDGQFEGLAADAEVEARLIRLKSGAPAAGI